MSRARVHAGAGRMPRGPASALLFAAFAAAAGAGAVLLSAPDRVVHASSPPASGLDTDGDGLPDLLETQLGTSIDLADTDGDGYSDLEELARGSNPLSPLSIPQQQEVQVSVSAYLDPAGLHPFTCIYVQGGDVTNKHFEMGVRVGGKLMSRPVSHFLGGAAPLVLQGAAASDVVLVLDGLLSPNLVQRFGSLSFFTTVSEEGVVVAAGAVNLFSTPDGEILRFVQQDISGGQLPNPNPPPTQGTLTGVYRPLAQPSGSPGNWIVGAICVQSMVTLGVVGPVLTQEVVTAECQDGWDSLCSPACPATVGTTVRLLDPAALIGG